MSLTSGFFNALNHDRLYDAEDFSAMFDGVINDGVFMTIGDLFATSAVSGLQLSVGSGRAWLGGKWIYNDTGYPITLDSAELILNRIDTVVIKSDSTQAVRACTIDIVKGTPGSTPVAPVLVDTDEVKYLPLANVYIAAGATTITQANITNRVGSSSCPFVTAILETTDIDSLFAQWGAQWDEWFEEERSIAIADMANYEGAFEAWFATVQDMMSEDVGTRLTAEVTALKTVVTLEVPVNGWSASNVGNYAWQITINDANLKATSTPIMAPAEIQNGTASAYENRDAAYSCIKEGVTGAGNVTFYAFDKPATTFSVVLKGV